MRCLFRGLGQIINEDLEDLRALIAGLLKRWDMGKSVSRDSRGRRREREGGGGRESEEGDREGEDERKNLILAQARVRLGAGVVAPWGQGGPKGCVVRKVGNKNIPNKDGKAGGVRGPSSGGARSADYFGTLVGESKVKAELRNLVDNRDGGIGQYQTLEQLGAGASGVVHLVRRIKDDTVWVAKRIQLTSGGNNLKMGPSSDRAAHMRRVQRDAVLEVCTHTYTYA